MKLITDIEVYGAEKLPKGDVIVAANHLGRLDTAALLCVMDREDIIMPVAEKYKNHPLYGAIGRAANAIWLNRFEADYSALREILARMEQGGMLSLHRKVRGLKRRLCRRRSWVSPFWRVKAATRSCRWR